MRQRKCHWRWCCAAAFAVTLASQAMAVTSFWDGGGANTNWDTLANWSGDTLPLNTNDVQFGGPFTSGTTIDTNGNRTVNSLIINTPTGFTLTGLPDVLTLTSGNITRNDVAGTEGNHFLGVDVALGNNGTWNISGSGALQIDGVVSGSGRSLTKNGAGTLVFGSGSNYSGGTFINGGVLQLNTSNAGTGAITIASGAELILSSATVSNPINLNGTGLSGSGAFRSTSTSNYSGAVTLQSSSAINSAAGTLTMSGVISDGANTFNLTKTGAGELRLTGNNAYHGTTTINAGLLTAGQNNALGSGAVTVASGASLGLLSGIGMNLPLTLNGAATTAGALFGDAGATSWSGPITFGSNSNIGVNAGTLTISGAIGQGGTASGLTKVGAGQLILSGANTYTGATTVTAGTLTVNVAAAINNSASVGVQNGASIEIASGVNASTSLSITGTGVGGAGVLRGFSGASNWSGPIAATGITTISSAGTMTISGPINATGPITKIGLGSLTLTNAANSFNNQDLNINAGTLNVSSENGLPASSLVNIADGATLLLTGGANINRSLRSNGDGVFGNLGLIVGTATWAGPVKFAADTGVFANGTLTVSGNIEGAGFTLTKKGNGKLTLAGVNSFATAIVNAGTLSVASSTAGPSSTVTVADQSSFELSGPVTIAGVSAHITGGGAAGGGAFRAANGNSTWSSPLVLDADSSVFVDAGAQLTLSGSVLGPGVMTKTGPGTLVLSGFSSNTSGGTIINGGTVSIADDDRLGGNGGEVIINGGKLLFTSNGISARDYNLTNGRLSTNVNTTLTGHVRGGFLMGPGTFVAVNGAIFSGTTSFAGSNITASGTAQLEAFTNGGNLTTSAAINWDGGVNSSSGVLSVQSNTLTTTAFTNDGVININGTLLNNGNVLTSGGGSRITINAGGALNVANGLALNGALLVNNGTINGTTNVNFGSLAKGAGVYGSVIVGDGGRFSPGNSPGSVTTGTTTWNSGGSYVVEIGNAATDFWQVDGILNIEATKDHPFTIGLASIDDLIFDYTRDFTWPILHADQIADLDPSQIALDISGFKAALGAGYFSLETSSNDILVHFSAVPEPAAMGAWVAGILLMRRQRRRCISCSHGEVT